MNNGSQAQKITNWSQRKQTGPKEPRERSSISMGIMRNRKQARMDQRGPK